MDHPQTPMSSNESPGYYSEDASPQTAEGELLSQETSRDVSIQNTEDDCSLLEQFSSEENNYADSSDTSEVNRKRKILTGEKITHDTGAYKRSKPEVDGMSDQVVSNFSDHGCINPNFRTNKFPVSSPIAFDSGSMACINSEFSSAKKSHRKNQELKVFYYSGKEENLSTGQHTTPEENIFPKENAAIKIKDTDVDKVANVGSGEDMLELPRTSQCRENNSLSNLSVKKVQNVSPLKQQPLVETEQKQLTCLACKKNISGHEKLIAGKAVWSCCRCVSIYNKFNTLLNHIYNKHVKLYYCSLCQMNYSEITLHARGGFCEVCNIHFRCKNQLKEHYLSEHEDLYEDTFQD